MTGDSTIDRPVSRSEAVYVFEELFELLEDYAPVWYSEELHYRAEAALRHLKSLNEN